MKKIWEETNPGFRDLVKHLLEKQLLEFQHILYSSFGRKQTFKEK